MLEHEKIRELSKLSNPKGVLLFVRDWTVIAAVAGLAITS